MVFRVGTFPGITSVSPGQGPAAQRLRSMARTLARPRLAAYGDVQWRGGRSSDDFGRTRKLWCLFHRVPVPDRSTLRRPQVERATMVFSGRTFPGSRVYRQGKGPPATAVTINGQNFGATQVAAYGDVQCVAAGPATTWTNTQIVVSVPSGASTGQIYVTTTAGGKSNGAYFAVTNPSITSLSQTSAAVGTTVTISGANFGADQALAQSNLMELRRVNGVGMGGVSIAVTVPNGATPATSSSRSAPLQQRGQFHCRCSAHHRGLAFPPPNAAGWNTTNVTLTYNLHSGKFAHHLVPAAAEHNLRWRESVLRRHRHRHERVFRQRRGDPQH